MLDTSNYTRYNRYMRRKNKEQPIELNDEQAEVWVSVKIFCMNNWNTRVKDLHKEIKQLFEDLDSVGWTRVKKYISRELSQSYAGTRFLELDKISILIKLDITDPKIGE